MSNLLEEVQRIKGQKGVQSHSTRPALLRHLNRQGHNNNIQNERPRSLMVIDERILNKIWDIETNSKAERSFSMITLDLERKCRTETLGSGQEETDSYYLLGTACPFRALNNSLEKDNGDDFPK